MNRRGFLKTLVAGAVASVVPSAILKTEKQVIPAEAKEAFDPKAWSNQMVEKYYPPRIFDDLLGDQDDFFGPSIPTIIRRGQIGRIEGFRLYQSPGQPKIVAQVGTQKPGFYQERSITQLLAEMREVMDTREIPLENRWAWLPPNDKVFRVTDRFGRVVFDA